MLLNYKSAAIHLTALWVCIVINTIQAYMESVSSVSIDK